ncbi:hypothetical protein [Flexivirga meconopsidis]|uniref:hypothetical protein n=1 Tax=Flexivirga meconopsidis TaxID=2977121 RepID=UPI00224051B0|nr:hypothetical protein [Flexivirga meconopsidis]
MIRLTEPTLEPFFDRPGVRWGRDGRLHVYLLPELSALDAAAHRINAVMPTQAARYRHLTVAQFPWYVDDLDPNAWQGLQVAIEQATLDIAPISVRLLPPVVVDTGVVVPCDVPGWADLTTFLSQLRLHGHAGVPVPTALPHVSLAYAVRPTSRRRIEQLIENVARSWEPVVVTASSLDLVAVNQRPETGAFTWADRRAFPLGG